MPVISDKGRAKARKRPGKMQAKRAVKRRSPAAAALAKPLFRKRVIKSAKLYNRKGKSRMQKDDEQA